MSRRRFHLFGLFAVLLALMAQLGTGASVPRFDLLATAVTLCHTDDPTGGTPSHTPAHDTDCPLCPLCVAAHHQAIALVSLPPIFTPLAVPVAIHPDAPLPTTAAPAPHRPPSQPRAPPIAS